MTDLRIAAQQALEALYQAREFTELYDTEHAAAVNERCHENITALRAALAQQAEPYRLPDDLYDSTDWRAGTYADRVAWLHAMYESAKKERDALLEALKRMASIIDKMGDMPDGFIHPRPWQTLKCEEALEQARAAIKAVEEGK